MTMNAINTNSIQMQQSAYQPAAAKHSPESKTPEDSVHLSSAAQASLGDVDHDGDSH
jgi:hypothetical protein